MAYHQNPNPLARGLHTERHRANWPIRETKTLTCRSLSTWGVTLAEMVASLSSTRWYRSVGFSMLVCLDSDIVYESFWASDTAATPSLNAVGPCSTTSFTLETGTCCFRQQTSGQQEAVRSRQCSHQLSMYLHGTFQPLQLQPYMV